MTRLGANVFAVILVTVLYYSETCNSQSQDAFAADYRAFDHQTLGQIYPKWSLLNRNHHRERLHQLAHSERVQHLLKRLKHSATPRKVFSNTPQLRHVYPRRSVRQAYSDYRPSLYPSLPTSPPSYQHQPYYNQNNQQNQASYTPPYNPQWQPTMQNNSQHGYPGNNNNGLNNPGYPGGYNQNYLPYNTKPSAPVSPNPNDNPLFGHGHGHRYPYTPPTNFSIFRPQNSSGYQPYPGPTNFNNRPTSGFNNNPSQRPPYYSSVNSSTTSPHRPGYTMYSTTQRYPVTSYNNTTQRTSNRYPNQLGPYNNSQPGYFNRSAVPGYPSGPSQSGPYGPYNPGQNYPNHNLPGYHTPKSNSTAGYPGAYQTGPYNNSFNGYRPNSNSQYPSPVNNNFTNSHNKNPTQAYYPYGNNITKPNPIPGTGYNGYNNFANSNPYHGNPQTNNQFPGAGFPRPQYNGTSTYILADHYTPNIPNQPPRNDFGPNNAYYSWNATDDPTRASAQRFSY